MPLLDWTMNLWDFKRFRLNDPALAHVYKSRGTLAKLVSAAGPEIHREMVSAAGGRGWVEERYVSCGQPWRAKPAPLVRTQQAGSALIQLSFSKDRAESWGLD